MQEKLIEKALIHQRAFYACMAGKNQMNINSIIESSD